MNKIHSITQAFSMQPTTLRVGDNVDLYDNESPIVGRIEYFINVNTGDKYRGYDTEGNLIFEWLANSVNVQYNPKEGESET